MLELIWAYPVLLFGIALGVSLELGGLTVGFIHVRSGSLLVPAIVIGIVYIPYVAKPIRGQVLQTRTSDFVAAARVAGMGTTSIMVKELLPSVASTILVFIPLTLANAILLEAGLSFLGAGVQPPNPSWGTMLTDGIRLVPAGFHLVVAPGLMLVLTVTSINMLGDALRDALDPKALITRR
jgi:peptide/nickel transport system permease protein